MAPTESTNRVQQQPSARQQNTVSSTSTESTTANTQCPECSGQLVKDATTKEFHCEDCGIITEQQNIDHGPDWKQVDDNVNRSRVGRPLTETHHDRGLSTEIGASNKDAIGNTLPPKQRRKMVRLRKWHKQSQTKTEKERGLRKGMGEIQRMKSALGLTKSTSETASVIFRRASSEDLLHGRAIEAIASAALYIGARMEGIPRTFQEVETVSRIGEETIRRSYSYLKRELEIGLEPVDPTKYIPRFSSKIEANQKIEREATRLARNIAGTKHISGRDPSNIAATALYVASLRFEENYTQTEIAEACQTNAVTIRKTTKLLIDADPETNLELDDIEALRTTEIGEKLAARQ